MYAKASFYCFLAIQKLVSLFQVNAKTDLRRDHRLERNLNATSFDN